MYIYNIYIKYKIIFSHFFPQIPITESYMFGENVFSLLQSLVAK